MSDELDIKKQFEDLREEITKIARQSVHDHEKMHDHLLDLIKEHVRPSDHQDSKDSGFIFDEESIASDLADLVPSNQIKYETIEEIAYYIDNLKVISEQYSSLSEAIDQIEFDSQSAQQDTTKIVDLVKDHVKHLITNLNPKDIEIDEKEMTSNIVNLVREIAEEQAELDEFDKELLKDGLLKKKDKKKNKEQELSRKHFKDIIKKFAMYQVYKIVNPRRIAGETKKDNYMHNMMRGGKKLASKYEGGRADEVASYKKNFVKQVNKAARKNRGFSR